MTEQEAIRILDINKIISFRCTGFVEAAECAISALEKQIPKKPEIYNRFQYHCECGEIVKRYQRYCSKCGQALDWSGEND